MENKRNFRCPESGEEFYFPVYITTFDTEGKKYKDINKRPISHPKTGVLLVVIEKDVDWSKGAPAHILGTSKSDIAKRTEQLKSRSKNHFKQEISEKKYEKNKDLIKKFEAKD